MSMNSLEDAYIQQRNNYLPNDIRLIFVFESPPAHKGYFYDDEGKSSELLYRTMTELLLGDRPTDKRDGLRQFAEAGYLLINPIYTPVNKVSDKEADHLILGNYPAFVNDLRSLIRDKDVPLILVKKNICRLLEEPLQRDGFTVLNKGRMVPFPMHYHQEAFSKLVKEMLTERFGTVAKN